MARARPPSAEHARRRSPPTRSRSAGPPRPGATTLCCAGRGPCTHRPNVVGGVDICWVITGRVSTECSCTQRHRRTTSRSRHAIPHSLSPLGVHLGGRSGRSGSAAGQPRYRGGVRGRCRRRIRYGRWSRLRRREGHGQFLSAGCCESSTRYPNTGRVREDSASMVGGGVHTLEGNSHTHDRTTGRFDLRVCQHPHSIPRSPSSQAVGSINQANPVSDVGWLLVIGITGYSASSSRVFGSVPCGPVTTSSSSCRHSRQ